MEHALGVRVGWLDVLSFDIAPLRLTMRRGDEREAEFETFFVEQYDAVAQSVRFVCGDAERANDATQEAFIRAYARWNRIRRYDNAGAWVRRIAINISRDAHRADTRRSRREERAAPPIPSSPHQVDDHSSVLDLLEKLPERQRAVAALYYLDDMAVAEISTVLDIAEGTVRFHLSEAHARLREHLDRRQQRAR